MLEIQPQKSVEIIAEVGCNHCGNMGLAYSHIDVASSCGVDTVKFQCFNTDNLVNAGDIAEFCRSCELNISEFQQLQRHCDRRNVQFLVSCFCIDSLDMADALCVDRIKVPSGQTQNKKYLAHLGKMKKKVLLSTGMCTIQDVMSAVQVLVENGTDPKDITLMQCTTAYPTPVQDVHLSVLWQFKELFPTVGAFGLSDHTKGIAASVFAAAMGYSVIERHFILDEAGDTPDKPASLDFVQMRTLVNTIRDGEMALGRPHKDFQVSECKASHRIDKVEQ